MFPTSNAVWISGGLRLLLAALTLNFASSCATAPNPAEGPAISQGAAEAGSLSGAKGNVAAPVATLSVTPTQVNEGGSASYKITLSKAASTALTVTYNTNGTAVRGTHYTLSGTKFTIAAGATTGTLTLSALNTGLNSGSETVTVTLKTGTPATKVQRPPRHLRQHPLPHQRQLPPRHRRQLRRPAERPIRRRLRRPHLPLVSGYRHERTAAMALERWPTRTTGQPLPKSHPSLTMSFRRRQLFTSSRGLTRFRTSR